MVQQKRSRDVPCGRYKNTKHKFSVCGPGGGLCQRSPAAVHKKYQFPLHSLSVLVFRLLCSRDLVYEAGSCLLRMACRDDGLLRVGGRGLTSLHVMCDFRHAMRSVINNDASYTHGTTGRTQALHTSASIEHNRASLLHCRSRLMQNQNGQASRMHDLPPADMHAIDGGYPAETEQRVCSLCYARPSRS